MSRAQEFFEVHANGKQVRPRFPVKVSVVDPHVMRTYEADTPSRIIDADFITQWDILIRACHVSPVLVFLRALGWEYRFTDTLASISALYQIIRSHSVTPDLTYTKMFGPRIRAALVAMDKAIRALEESFYDAVAKDMTKDQWLQVMSSYTIDRIQILERCAHAMFALPFPVEMGLTPHWFPTLDDLEPARKALMPRVAFDYYKKKQMLRNVRLEKALPEDTVFEPETYLNDNVLNSGWDAIHEAYAKFLKAVRK